MRAGRGPPAYLWNGRKILNTFVLVQILGIITLIFFVVSLQQRRKEIFLLLQIFGTLFYIVQYILTEKYTGAILFSVVVARGIVFYIYKKKDRKPSLKILLIFQAALLTSTVLSWQNALSLIPYLATGVKTWGAWQDDMKWVRRASAFCQILTVAYNLTAAMYTGALTEICSLSSTFVAMWRYDLKKDNKIAERMP